MVIGRMEIIGMYLLGNGECRLNVSSFAIKVEVLIVRSLYLISTIEILDFIYLPANLSMHPCQLRRRPDFIQLAV